jgi:hypothetical protein
VKRQNANLPQTQRLASFKANEAPRTHSILLRVLDWTYTGPAHRVASLFKVSLAAGRAIDDVYENVFGYF